MNTIQLRIFGDTLTDEQTALEARYWQAVDILKAAGFPAEYCKVIVTETTDQPGYITFSRRPK